MQIMMSYNVVLQPKQSLFLKHFNSHIKPFSAGNTSKPRIGFRAEPPLVMYWYRGGVSFQIACQYFKFEKQKHSRVPCTFFYYIHYYLGYYKSILMCFLLRKINMTADIVGYGRW